MKFWLSESTLKKKVDVFLDKTLRFPGHVAFNQFWEVSRSVGIFPGTNGKHTLGSCACPGGGPSVLKAPCASLTGCHRSVQTYLFFLFKAQKSLLYVQMVYFGAVILVLEPLKRIGVTT